MREVDRYTESPGFVFRSLPIIPYLAGKGEIRLRSIIDCQVGETRFPREASQFSSPFAAL